MDGMQFQLSEAQGPKLTGWKKEPTLQQLKYDLDTAKLSQGAQIARIEHWQELMDVTGKAAPPKIKNRSSVQPKLIRRQAEWRYPALTEPFLSSEKLYKVSPVTFEDGEAAKQNELVLNWQWSTKIDRVKFIDDYVRATVDEGTSIVRVGWKRVTVRANKEVPVWTHYAITTEDRAQLLQQALELKASDPRTFLETVDPAMQEAVTYYQENQVPTFAVQTGTETVQVDLVIENRPTVELLNPRNVFIDPTCGGDLSKALFVIVSFETNKAELLKEGKRYRNLDRVNWQGNAPLTNPDHATTTPDTFQFNDALKKKVVAYEYWGYHDINGDGKLVPFVATWIGDVLVRMELNPYPDEKLPFVLVPYSPVKRDLFGQPDAELLEDNQRILGAVTRGMIDLLGRSANGQTGHAKGMLDTLNRRKFEDGRDYEFNPSIHPSNGLIEHKYPELPQSALTMLQLQNAEAEALTGVKSFSGGISGEAYGDVAAGIRGMLDAAAKREMAILRRLAKGMGEIGTKIISMNAEFLSEEETVRVTNREFVKIRREDLKGNFDLKVDISTAEIDNMKAQDLGFILQTLGPNADPSIYMMILAEICELKRMPVLAEKIRTWQPKLSPAQEELQRLEIEKARMEVEKLRSEVELNQAKAQAEMAKKDKLDLDYVEQESGTTHARDLQKQQAQARGNQNLEVTKAMTKPLKEGEKRPDIMAAVGFNEVSEQLGVARTGAPALVSAPA